MKATLTLDTSGIVRMWSREAEALLGYSAAEAVGRSVEFIIPPHLRGRHSAGFARYVKTGVSNLPEVAISPAIHKSARSRRCRSLYTRSMTSSSRSSRYRP
jgi:PAS domain-containing protein